jgi:hypothetical protein
MSPQNPRIKSAIKLKQPYNLKTLNLIYLLNFTLLGKNKHTTSIRTLENGGLNHLQTFKFYES